MTVASLVAASGDGGTAALAPPAAAAQPRSWAEDVQTYRATRGSRAWSTTDDAPPPRSFGRTCLVPFLATQHKLYPYNDFPDQDGGEATRQDPDVHAQRCSRHGWGDVSLLKLEGVEAGSLRLTRSSTWDPDVCRGKMMYPVPIGADGRCGLFGVLNQTEAGGRDNWIGHPLIAPDKGKRALLPSSLSASGTHGSTSGTGIGTATRKKPHYDLFEVLQGRGPPGVPADDAWIGNIQIDPAKGKGRVPGPEQRRGRRDLSDVFTQSIMQDPNRAELMKKGRDPLGDAWCGHRHIDPNKGKAPGAFGAGDEAMLGATFKKPIPPDWTDFKRRHTKLVPGTAPDTARQVLDGTAPPETYQRGKREVAEGKGPRLLPRADLYAHMTFRPLTGQEQQVYRRAWNDRDGGGRRTLTAPGSDGVGQGRDMLAWRPEQAIGRFVPFGKLAQEGRVTKRCMPGGTMPRAHTTSADAGMGPRVCTPPARF